MVGKCRILGISLLIVGVVLIPIIGVTIHSRKRSSGNDLKLLIDHDGGADDAMAIFMALLYEKYFDGPEVIGLTTNHGNVYEDQVFNNTQRILDIAQRRDVPIYRGSNTSLVIHFVSDFYYGKDGLGDTDFHSQYEPIEAHDKHAVMALIEMSKKYEGKLIVISIGPLTNIAMAMRLDPKFVDRLAHLYVAAGNIQDESNPDPEFNAYVDVEAYYVVAANSNPEQVTVIPFSQTKSSMNISRDWRVEVLGYIGTETMKALNEFERLTIPLDDTWDQLDPAAMSIALNESVATDWQYSKNSIALCEDRGITTFNLTSKEDSNIRLMYQMDEEAFKTLLLDVFSAESV